jgi:hypothetical protein
VVLYQDANILPGHRYDYRVAPYVHDRYLGPWSATLSHAWGVLPRTPRDFKAESGDAAATLSWSPVAKLADGAPLPDLAGYFLYRQSPKENWRRLTPEPLTGTRYQDVALTNEVTYTYKIRAVRRLGGDLLESADLPALTVVPVDLTPPPPVINLVAVPTREGVTLRWDDSSAPDLAGYRVYRRGPGEAKYLCLTPKLLTKPYFVDAQAGRGRSYYYTVTAVDNSKRVNESLPSEEAAAAY